MKKNKYFTEIMPQIRKTGKYILEGKDIFIEFTGT